MRPYQVVLLDIEGTTTPISFVTEVLFPYARAHFGAYLSEHWGSDAVKVDVERFRALALEDIAAGAEGAVEVPADEAGEEAVRAALLQSALWQMDHDRKSTALKAVQGRIWKAGYANGTLKASLFEDVIPSLKRWEAEGTPVYIYSSGSIQAQKLLFGHTEAGDVLNLLAGHFDTTSGSKKESPSYARIAASIGVAPEAILFATDVSAEADAATSAGVQAVIMNRPGNHPQPEHAYPTLDTFAPLFEITQ